MSCFVDCVHPCMCNCFDVWICRIGAPLSIPPSPLWPQIFKLRCLRWAFIGAAVPRIFILVSLILFPYVRSSCCGRPPCVTFVASGEYCRIFYELLGLRSVVVLCSSVCVWPFVFEVWGLVFMALWRAAYLSRRQVWNKTVVVPLKSMTLNRGLIRVGHDCVMELPCHWCIMTMFFC